MHLSSSYLEANNPVGKGSNPLRGGWCKRLITITRVQHCDRKCSQPVALSQYPNNIRRKSTEDGSLARAESAMDSHVTKVRYVFKYLLVKYKCLKYVGKVNKPCKRAMCLGVLASLKYMYARVQMKEYETCTHKSRSLWIIVRLNLSR